MTSKILFAEDFHFYTFMFLYAIWDILKGSSRGFLIFIINIIQYSISIRDHKT